MVWNSIKSEKSYPLQATTHPNLASNSWRRFDAMAACVSSVAGLHTKERKEPFNATQVYPLDIQLWSITVSITKAGSFSIEVDSSFRYEAQCQSFEFLSEIRLQRCLEHIEIDILHDESSEWSRHLGISVVRYR